MKDKKGCCASRGALLTPLALAFGIAPAIRLRTSIAPNDNIRAVQERRTQLQKTEVCPCSVSEELVPMNKKLPLKEVAVEAP
jgi:hypothetical protein